MLEGLGPTLDVGLRPINKEKAYRKVSSTKTSLVPATCKWFNTTPGLEWPGKVVENVKS